MLRNLGMKKMLLFFFTLAVVHPVMAEDLLLQIWQTDGQVTTINLNEEPVTTYSEGNLIITTTKAVITYPLEKVAKYTYVSTEGIETIDAMNTKFSLDGETLYFSGLKQGTEIAVYASSGQMMRKVKTGRLNSTTVSVSGFAPGMYLVKVNGLTYKITKR